MSCKINQPESLFYAFDLLKENSEVQCASFFKDFRFSVDSNRLTKSYPPTTNLTSVTEEILIQLPYGSVTRAIPSYEIEGGGSVFVNGVSQENGVSILDFSESKTFELISNHNQTCRKTLQVSVQPISPVVDTGVKECYDQSAVLPMTPSCSGDDSLRQDGVWTDVPNPRSWSPAEQITTVAGIVRDRLTGLIWRKCPRGQASATGCSGDPDLISYEDARSYCSLYLNNFDDGKGYGGFKNWRLPTVHELSSLMDYSKNNTDGLLDPNSFPNAVVTSAYNWGFWALQSWAENNAEAWRVRFTFDIGTESILIRAKTSDRMVRCVSSSLPPERKWRVRENTILDERTQLEWEKCISGQNLVDGRCEGTSYTAIDWQNALKSCQTKEEGWRLPNTNELFSLYNYNLVTPGLDLDVFLGAPNDARYWTSTTDPTDISRAFYQDPQGRLNISSKTSHNMFRCVRTSVD
jgi:hypothetical protein